MTEPAARASRYTTLARDADATVELEVRRSRFLACLRRVETEEAARAFVAERRHAHHDARHHCSAFVLGPDRDVQRSSDDGEPAGTAGVPMLEALVLRQARSGVADLSDVCAVVTRYFGGVKLGAGGLVRAYSDAVSAALDGARLVSRERRRLFDLVVGHEEIGRLEDALRSAGAGVTGVAYTPDVATLTLAVVDAEDAAAALAARVAALTVGRGALVGAGTAWVDRPL